MESTTCSHGAVSNIKKKSSNKQEILQFWSLFRNLCHDFNQQIDALLLLLDGGSNAESTSKEWNDDMKNKVRCHYATASKRNEGRSQLDSVQKEVRLLQQHVLSSSSSMAAASSTSSTNENSSLNEILSQSVPDLPLTDIRLLSVEMEKILNRIDDGREMICPKEKFVFRRYRKAMKELNQNISGEEVGSSDLFESCKLDVGKMQQVEEQPKEEQQTQAYGGAIENKSNCIIELITDGSVNINNEDNSQKQWQIYAVPRPYHASPDMSSDSTCPSSYLLQNLTNVTVILHPTLQSLHIQNIHNCKLYSTVLGPVHVTNCQNSTIRCSAYQLRVHDSKNVDFGVWARSGPIIEDCTAIVFAGDFYSSGEPNGQPGRNMYWDVKDFNWLRCLRKSPNFTVVEMSNEGGAGGNGGTVVPEVDTNRGQEEMDAPVATEEDSEDEL